MVLNDGESRRRIGREIKRRRERAGMSQRALSRKIARGQTTISAYEAGRFAPTPDDLDRIDHALSTSGALRGLWESLSAGGGEYPSWFRGLVVVEAEASEIWEYQPLVVPGLLQTADYARAQIRTGRPGDTEEEIEARVRGRLDRQGLLSAERGPVVRMVVEEHVLRRPVGGCAILKAQLDALLKSARLPRVTLQVVPMGAEEHYGNDGAFLLLRVPGRGRIVYTETRVDSHPREDPEAVEDYMSVFSGLCGYALSPPSTIALIEEIRSELDA